MSILTLGLNHRSAPLSLLERTAVPDSRLPRALFGAVDSDLIYGAVILSTCNRTEIYASTKTFHGAYEYLKCYLSDISKVGESELSSHIYSYSDSEVATHLFFVVSGLDSAILGEHEIQGQVKRAWAVSHEERTSDTALNDLFQSALKAGKKVRSQTRVSSGADSVSDAAFYLASESLNNLNDKKALVLGTGEMGNRIATLLARNGASQIAIASRTWKNAQILADELNCKAVHLDELGKELLEADIFFASTGSSSLLLEREELNEIMKARDYRPLVIMDIAVPRDVDPTANDLEGVILKDIDDVRAFASSTFEHYDRELARAQEILAEEVTRYESHQGAYEMSPLITEFRRRICDISQDEFIRYSNRLASLEPSEMETVEELIHSIINKVLHDPTVSIQQVQKEEAKRLSIALKELFKLN